MYVEERTRAEGWPGGMPKKKRNSISARPENIKSQIWIQSVLSSIFSGYSSIHRVPGWSDRADDFFPVGMGVVEFPWILVIELYLGYVHTAWIRRKAVKAIFRAVERLMGERWGNYCLGCFASILGGWKRKNPQDRLGCGGELLWTQRKWEKSRSRLRYEERLSKLTMGIAPAMCVILLIFRYLGVPASSFSLGYTLEVSVL